MSTLKLLTPGPVCLHPEARRVLAAPQLHHRSEEASEQIAEARTNIAKMAGSSGEALILTGSGTAAMEALLRAFFAPGETVWVPVAGKFSQRWMEIARSAGLKVLQSEFTWGESVPLESVPTGIDGALLTHSETSTGVLHDLRGLAERVKQANPGARVLADAITSFMLTHLAMDDWRIDGVAIGSQKGLMSPPGIAFAVISKKHLSGLRSSGYYLDLAREMAQQKKQQTAFTPAINLIAAVAAVSRQYQSKEALSKHLRHKEQANKEIYRVGESYGLQPVPKGVAARSPATAAFYLPKGLTPAKISRAMLERGWRIAGGQGPLKGKTIRLSAMGYLREDELAKALEDFSQVLADHL